MKGFIFSYTDLFEGIPSDKLSLSSCPNLTIFVFIFSYTLLRVEIEPAAKDERPPRSKKINFMNNGGSHFIESKMGSNEQTLNKIRSCFTFKKDN